MACSRVERSATRERAAHATTAQISLRDRAWIMLRSVQGYAPSLNDDRRPPTDPGEHPLQITCAEGDAAGSRRSVRPGEVKEHRTAAPGDPRPGVVIDFDDEIVEMVLPPE